MRTADRGERREYRLESMRPLTSLIFITPLLLTYETGVLLLGSQAVRNGADIWLRDWLDHLGFGQHFLLPLLTCSILLGWHHTLHDQWQLRWRVLGGMLVESAGFALALVAIGQVQSSLYLTLSTRLSAPTPPCLSVTSVPVNQLVGYCGAGIYEELLFRLMLLPVVAAVFRGCGLTRPHSLLWAVVATSLAFSAAHYELFTTGGEAFHWFSFCFRFTAGVCFSLLFVFRGFGIAAASHALYDILIVSL